MNTKTNNKILSTKSEENISPYVTVKNNQYILNNQVKNIISSKDYQIAEETINYANAAIKASGAIINKDSKTATNLVQGANYTPVLNNLVLARKKHKYHYGINKIIFHWNYAKIYLDKRLANNLAEGIISGASTLLGGLAGGIGWAAVASAIGSFLSSEVGHHIKGGVWIDYNYVLHGPTKFGWQ